MHPRNPLRDDEERFEILRELKRSLTVVLETASSKDRVADFVLTDSEACVQDLVAWIERSLWHGLKRYASESNEALTIWSVVSSHLSPPPDETQAVDQVLRQGSLRSAREEFLTTSN